MTHLDPQPTVYVFGAFGAPGHFLFGVRGHSRPEDVTRDVSDSCDVQSDPRNPYARREEPEGMVRPTSPPPGWSYVAWWDRQGDKRSGSTTGILARGEWTADQLLDAARRVAPWALRVRVYGPGITEPTP